MRIFTGTPTISPTAPQVTVASGGLGIVLRLHDLLDAEVVDVRQGAATLRVAGQLLAVALKTDLTVGQHVKLLVRDLTPSRVTLQVLQPPSGLAARPLSDADVDLCIQTVGRVPTMDTGAVA